MVRAYSAGYGVFSAKPLSNDRAFAWAADLRTSEAFTVLHSVYQSSGQFGHSMRRRNTLRFTFRTRDPFDCPLEKRWLKVGGSSSHGQQPRGWRSFHPRPALLGRSLPDWKVVRRMLVSLMETPILESLDLEPVVDLATPSGQLIGSLVQTIVQGMRNDGPLLSSPLAVAAMSETLANLVIRFGRHRLSGHMEKKKVSLVAPWHVRRAIDYMHANIAEPLTMTMVADDVGVSLRALQTGFKAFRELHRAVTCARSGCRQPATNCGIR